MESGLTTFGRNLSALRHDLRNSVGHILGYSEMLQEDLEDHPDEEFLNDIARIHESGQQLLDLIEEHLGVTHTALDEIDLPFIQHQLRIQLNHVLGYAELVLETAEEAGAGEVAGDLERIAQSAAALLGLLEERLTGEHLGSASEGEASPADGAPDGETPEEVPPSGEEVPTTAPPAPDLSGTILVVDDDPLNREMLERRLVRQGHEVATAADGEETLEYLEGHLPDVVLLDMKMPGLTGADVLERMKADRRLRSVPVIMLSGSDDMDSIVRCVLMGAEDYLMKPANPVLLRARLEATLEKHRLRQRQEKARLRMEEELNVGRDIQMSMLPLVFPPFPERSDFSVFAMLEAAREVGGDFYDLFLIDENRFCFCVGDVSGKGVPAALFMAVTKTLLKSRSSFDSSPGSIFTHVNDEMAADNDASMFVTLWMAILDTRTGEVVYSNAGHNPPFVKRADGSLLRLDKLHGPVIGAMEGLPYGEDSVTMRPGDTLFLYTDGVTEAMDPPGDLYGEDRLCEILEEPDHTTVEDLVEASAADVWRFQAEAEQADDVTILAVQYHPAAAALAVFEMAIAPDLQEIDRVNAAVDDFASENTLEDDLRRSLKLAVDELLNNAISYGTPAEHDHKLSVRLERSESHLTLTFRDNGTPFNPLELEAPDTEAPIESREIGGLGIHLVRALADDIRYARDDGWNVLILQKSLTT